MAHHFAGAAIGLVESINGKVNCKGTGTEAWCLVVCVQSYYAYETRMLLGPAAAAARCGEETAGEDAQAGGRGDNDQGADGCTRVIDEAT